MPESAATHDAFEPLPERELLGSVTAPSGILVVLDMGLLNLWCHDRPPRIPEGILAAEMTASVNAGVDLRIEGPDAERAGRAFDRQWHPLYLYDMPTHGNETIYETFDRVVREQGLNAHLVPLAKRVPHRRRINLALEHGRGAGEFQFFGPTGVAVGDVPRGKKLPVYGARTPENGPDADRWRRVWVECRPNTPVARSEPVGTVAVDEARLIVADADALGAWRHDEPLDGRADLVFWGRDSAQLAAEAGAERLSDNQWGWLDLPTRSAVERGMTIERLREDRGYKLALDFRPHSHHYEVMKQVRESVTEAGTLMLGGASVCGFMTSWGDGMFPVERDLDANGQLVRLRIELGCDDIVERQRRFEEDL